MRKLLLNTYAWVALAFFIVALIDLGNDGSIWIVWFALGVVFAIIAYRKPNPSTRTDPHSDGPNETDGNDSTDGSDSSSEETP